jgi:hypothetical protein
MTDETNLQKLIIQPLPVEGEEQERKERIARIRKARKLFFQYTPIEDIPALTNIPKAILYERIYRPDGWIAERVSKEKSEKKKQSVNLFGMSYQLSTQMLTTAHEMVQKLTLEWQNRPANIMEMDLWVKALKTIYAIAENEQKKIPPEELEALNPDEVVHTFMKNPFLMTAKEQKMIPPPTEEERDKLDESE